MRYCLHQANFYLPESVEFLRRWQETLRWPFRNLVCSIILSRNVLRQDLPTILRNYMHYRQFGQVCPKLAEHSGPRDLQSLAVAHRRNPFHGFRVLNF